MPAKLNIIFCVESGPLEQQALLLIASAKRWLNLNNCRLIAYSPRINHHPAASTLSVFKQQGVAWVSVDINKDFGAYPIANKVLACKHFVESNPGASKVMFVDTDTVFLNDIDSNLLSADNQLYVRPVDNKGPGSESSNDVNDKFWRQVFKLCAVQLPDANVHTTVRPAIIRNYFNAGLIWIQGLEGFFQQWFTDFMTIIDSNLRPFGYQSRDGDDFRCLDQVALAVTATRFAYALKILPESYNYPLPFRPIMHNRENHPDFNQLVHVHYHKWFQHPEFLNHVTSDFDKTSLQYSWLNSQLPIKPEINQPFKC